MVNSANICIFEGRITRDPQYSTVQIGNDSVEKALFNIAVERVLSAAQRQKIKNGDKSIKTADFIPCSLLGAQVATLRQYFPVGKAIRIIGRYTEYQTTDGQTGQTKYGHIFEIDQINFPVQDPKSLQNNQGGGSNQQYQQNNGYQQQNQYPQNNGYQQQSQQQYQQPAAQANFSMFDEGESPF